MSVSDTETAEVRWIRSEQGKAAHQAAWLKLHEMGLHRHVEPAQLTQVIYAAHLAAAEDEEPEEQEPAPSACEHDWQVRNAQDCTPWVLVGKPAPHTAVLGVCAACGQPESWLLIGEWTLQDLTGGQS